MLGVMDLLIRGLKPNGRVLQTPVSLGAASLLELCWQDRVGDSTDRAFIILQASRPNAPGPTFVIISCRYIISRGREERNHGANGLTNITSYAFLYRDVSTIRTFIQTADTQEHAYLYLLVQHQFQPLSRDVKYYENINLNHRTCHGDYLGMTSFYSFFLSRESACYCHCPSSSFALGTPDKCTMVGRSADCDDLIMRNLIEIQLSHSEGDYLLIAQIQHSRSVHYLT